MAKIVTIGLDLAKNVFQVHGVDGAGAVMVRRQLRRTEVLSEIRPRRSQDAGKPAALRSPR
jgi:hypothetical protein